MFEVSGSEDGGGIAFELGCLAAFLHRLFRLESVACAGVSVHKLGTMAVDGGVHRSQEGHLGGCRG